MAINVLKANTNPHNLPNEYQEVEWIKSKDNAYINPNVNITADIGFEVTANIPTGTNGALLGNYLPGNYFFFVYAYTNNTTTFFPSKNASTVSMTVPRDTKTTFSFKNGVLDDGTTQTTISSYATAEIGQPLYLFSGRPNNWFTSYTLYEFKIYNGSTVVKHLIPCYRKADGEIGLYDIITDNFYSNANSVGSFEKGNNAISYTTQKMKINLLSDGIRLPAEYEEVEYLKSSGTQYIDTGIKLSSSDTVKAKFEIISKPTDYSYREGIYGTMESINSTNTFFVLLMRTPTLARVGTSSNQTTSTNVELNKIYDTVLSNGTYVENGTTYNFTKNSGFTFTTNCYVFARNQASMLPTSAKFYSFEIVDKFKGVPCYRKSDNVAGFYDMISGTFFTNAGTGSFVVGPRVNLPDEYQEVEYLESTGTQYIDTNYIPNQDTVVNCHINLVSYNANDVFFGQRVAYMDNQYEFVAFNTQYVPQLRYDNQTTGAIGGSVLSTGDHYIETSKNGLFIDNNRVGNTLNATTFTCQYSIYLFARNNAGTAGAFSNIKLYSLEISENNTLIRKFVPCYRKTDSVAGLYDMQNNQFYTNAGTGTFSVGNDVPKYKIQTVKMNILKETNNLLKLKRREWNSTSYQSTDLVTFDYNKMYYMAGSGYVRPYDGALNETITRNSVTFTQTSSSWWGIGFPFEVKPNTKYTIGAKRLDGTKTKMIYSLYNADGSFASYAQVTTNTSILDMSLTITTGANIKTMIIVVAGITQGDTIYAYDIQVEEGQTRTDFKPYGYEIIKI